MSGGGVWERRFVGVSPVLVSHYHIMSGEELGVTGVCGKALCYSSSPPLISAPFMANYGQSGTGMRIVSKHV